MEGVEEPLDSVIREVEEETGITMIKNIHYDGGYYVRSDWGDDMLHFFHHKTTEKYEITLSEREHQNHRRMKPEDALELELLRGLEFNLRKLFGL